MPELMYLSRECVWFAHTAQRYIAFALYGIFQAARIFRACRGRYSTMLGWKETAWSAAAEMS